MRFSDFWDAVKEVSEVPIIDHAFFFAFCKPAPERLPMRTRTDRKTTVAKLKAEACGNVD